jgi:SPP1 gp7 family putative phage head morphogenesis protein
MNSQEYWSKREAEALKHYITNEKAYEAEIKRIYSDMLDACQSEINAFYGKYATKEGVSIAEAKKRVKQADIAAYERKAKRYVKDKDFSAKANEEMRLYNTMMKINRLEMLKANIGLELISGSVELDKFMEGVLKGRTEEELKRQAGILGKTIKNNAQKAHAIVNGSFHSGTFSDRIWQYQDLMREQLGALLQTGLIQGKNPRALTKDLKKYFIGKDGTGGMRYCMERLMRTELARVQTEAQKQSFERNGFEEYEFIVNGGCCEICEALKGKHFKVSKMMPGENAPPMHPHCRCSTAAYSDRKEYEEWLDFLDKGGTTEEYNRQKALKINSSLTNKGAKSDKIELLADINKMLTTHERRVLDAVPKKDGYFDFAAHGAPNAIEYGSEDMMLSARDVANIIRHNKNYNGEKIRLLSCSTGSLEDGFAQQLANALGVEVEAPSDILYVYPNGTYKVGFDGSGEMRKFKPGRKG